MKFQGYSLSRRFNVGIAGLKILACFGVVSLHFGSTGMGRRLAVPTFVFVSFFLTSRLFSCIDFTCLRRRLFRLLLPYVVWGGLGYLWYSCLSGFCLSPLYMQLLVGRYSDMPVGYLYYLEVLVLITSFLYCLPRRHFQFELFLVLVFSFVLQYTGVNYSLWMKAPGDIANTFGRIIEFMPYACAGLLVSHYEMIVKRNPMVLICALIVALTVSVAFYCAHSLPCAQGFSYQGLPLFTLTVSVCCAVILFSPDIPDGLCMKVVGKFAMLTSGIYYIHGIVGELCKLLWGMERSFVASLLVYFIGAIFALMLSSVSATRWMVK